MFSGPGNVSAFFERLRAALAPEYELLPELGRGGMGTVYLARDVALDCLVAVKVLRPELWTARSVKQFVDEARTLANLRHPNIVPVHSVHEKDGLNFYDAARKVGRDLQRTVHGSSSGKMCATDGDWTGVPLNVARSTKRLDRKGGGMARAASVFTLLLIAGCDTSSRIAAPPALSADRFGHPAIIVHAGGSIQAAIDAARPGAVIEIEPGTYAEGLHVDKPGLKLVGRRGRDGAGVVIENPANEEIGILVSSSADGFALVNVTVRGFEDDGVLLSAVDGFLLSGVSAVDNGEYGLFPVQSSHGVIERCIASGHEDTGIYVGQSHDVQIRHNIAFANVNGIEIENSSQVRAVANETYDNVVGILVVLLPGLIVNTSSDILVAGNRVHHNNHVNFAEPGEFESFVPSGSGILIVGADGARVEHNTVSGNQFVGIAVGSTLLLGALAGLPPEAFSDIEPNPDQVVIRNNRVTGNGTASPIPFLPAVDLLWDGSGVGDCWGRNRFVTSFPDPLPACAP